MKEENGKEEKESGPQIENGHIDIANELVEALAKTYLSSRESKILWALWRMTWGYVERDKKGKIIYRINKKGNQQPIKIKRAKISTKKWIELTGLNKSNISSTLKRLCKRNIVIQTDNKYKSMTWEFQKHYNKWLSRDFVIQTDNNNLLSKSGTNKPNLLSKPITGVIETDNKIISKPLKTKAKLITKKTLQRKHIYKEREDDIYKLEEKAEKEREIFDYWNSLDIIEHKTFSFFKDEIKEALKNYSLGEIKESIKNYSLILRGEEYYYTYRHMISGFLDPKNFEKFRDLEKAKKNYLTRSINNNPDNEAVEYERYKPGPGKSETEEERKDRYKESAKRIGDLKRELKEKKGD